MKLYFAGAEKSAYLRILLGANVERMAINVTHLAVPKRKAWSIPEVFPGVEVVAYTSQDDADLDRYSEFVKTHYDDLAIIIGRSDYQPAEWVLDKYYPLWADGEDMERLAYLCETYHRVAVPDRNVAEARDRKRVLQLIKRHEVSALAMTSKTETIDALPWDLVVAGSWSSAARYGETQVWDGKNLRRYPAAQKATARKKHRADVLKLGIDHEALLDDDATTASLLAVKSWQAYEAARTGYRPSTSPTGASDDEVESPSVATKPGGQLEAARGSSMATGIATDRAQVRHERARVLLPMLRQDTIDVALEEPQVDDETGTVVASRPVSTLRIRSESSRTCDSCYLAARCPAFEAEANCAFEIPLEIKTKDQLAAMGVGLIELQIGRALFAAYGEQTEGAGIDVGVSAELDRVFAMMGRLKEFTTTGDVLRLSVEAQGNKATAGVISRLFGEQAGAKARELPGGGLGMEATNRLAADVINVKG